MQSLFLRSVAIVQFYRWYSGEITKSSAVVRFDPSPTSGLIAYKADFVSFLTRRSRKVLGFKHQDVRS
jgi:hypothetical protein